MANSGTQSSGNGMQWGAFNASPATRAAANDHKHGESIRTLQAQSIMQQSEAQRTVQRCFAECRPAR